MAKKAVASLKKKDVKLVKAIRLVKKNKTGSYTFEQKILSVDQTAVYFEKKEK